MRGALRVSISSNDEEIIRKINRAMSSEYAITLHSGTYSTGFAKPYMIEKLQSFGLIERKSKTIDSQLVFLRNIYVISYVDTLTEMVTSH
ncbi:hypothetical protein AAAC51_08070 [Priestia megaterium]